MSRALIVTIATLLAAPALADEPAPKPAPKAEPAPASSDPVAPPAHANGEHSAKPTGERAPDLRANPRAVRRGEALLDRLIAVAARAEPVAARGIAAPVGAGRRFSGAHRAVTPTRP